MAMEHMTEQKIHITAAGIKVFEMGTKKKVVERMLNVTGF